MDLDQLRAAVAPQYTVERAIGAGGMGGVYLGRDATLDRAVAIKVIAPELAASAAFRERFLHEARTVARLRHPNIVAVFAAGERGDLLWYVMEYVPGESLRALLDREPRPDASRTAAIVHDVAAALAYAHAHGVVHRDLKPENILLDAETGRAMLTDFGVAKSSGGGGDSRTGTGIVLGSPKYMSPEQATGERDLDGRSDLYALGLVGYEMLTGAPAFGSASGPSLIAKQVMELPAPAATRAPDAPPALARAIDRALAKSPDERWPDADAMIAAMEGDAGQPPAADPGAPGSTAESRERAALRHRGPGTRRWLAGAAIAAIALVAAGVAWSRSRSGVPRGVDPRKSFFVAPFEVQGGDPRLAWLHDGAVSMLTSDLALWSDLSVVDYERTLDMLRAEKVGTGRVGLEQARALARGAGAWTAVLGQVTPAGDSLAVTARVYDVASGRLLREVQQSAAAAADPRALFDRVAKELLDLAGAPNMTPDVARQTTTSLEAYRAYLDGVRALNAWRLDEADLAFKRATLADSTFALAAYKRGIAIGWRSSADSTLVPVVEGAMRHASRLSERDQGLLAAYDQLARGLRTARDPAQRALHLQDAQRRYEALVARDSMDAEAWYGLADAYFHDTPQGTVPAAAWTRALRGFARTIRLDSTFHLAYAHTTQIFSQAARPGAPIVVEGDSVLDVSSARRAEGAEAPRTVQLRRQARARALEEARRWMSAAPDAPQPYVELSNAYAVALQFDSAAAVLGQALERPGAALPEFRYMRYAYAVRGDVPGAPAMLQDALARAPAESLNARHSNGNAMFQSLSMASAAAAMRGALGEMDRIFAEMLEVPIGSPVPQATVVAGLRGLTRGLVGAGTPEARRGADSLLAAAEKEIPEGAPKRTNLFLPYAFYLAWRDVKYLALAERWLGDSVGELRALAALERGDTATAARLARAFPPADTTATDALAIVREATRGAVTCALGEPRLGLPRFTAMQRQGLRSIEGPIQYHWMTWVRALHDRARCEADAGDRTGAIRDYRRLLVLWDGADAAMDAQKRDVQGELAKLTDAKGQAVR